MKKPSPSFRKTDVELVEWIKRGDELSFEYLFERYYEPLCRFAFSFLNSYEMSEELVTDVFMTIWRKRENLDIKSSIKVYLFSSVKYQCFAQMKKGIKMVELRHSEDISPDLIDLNTPLECMVYYELKLAFDAAIQSLPAQCKLIYHMHFTEGLRYKEIAEVLNISPKTVENHLGKALKSIREMIKKQESSKV